MLDKVKKRLQDQINELNHELKHELPKEIDAARSLGDLKENAEYHAAKDRQKYVESKVASLQKRLSEISLINLNRIPKDRAAYGSTLEIYDIDKDEEFSATLVTQEEADPDQGFFSLASPLGKALLGSKEGDEVKATIPSGIRSLEILSLVTIHDKEE